MAKLEGFLSWSGERSECLARRINEWLPIIVPNVQLFFSSVLSPGAMWSEAIAAAVRRSKFAILCVTSENLGSHWLQFEAGALWRGATENSMVCPLLLGVTTESLPETLKLFQAKQFDERGFKDLCRFLADKTRLHPDKLRYGFETTWPSLKRDVEYDLSHLKPVGGPTKRSSRRKGRAAHR